MTDPYTVLAVGNTPSDPDPFFAAALRGRLEHLLHLPEGEIMTDRTISPETTPQDADCPAAIPYLAVTDARAAIAWYGKVFGAEVKGEPYVMDDNRIGHCELQIGPGVIYLSDAHPELGVTAPREGEHNVSLMLRVDDADVTLARAEAEGGHRDREPYDGYGRRNAWMVDPFGHRWGLNSPLH